MGFGPTAEQKHCLYPRMDCRQDKSPGNRTDPSPGRTGHEDQQERIRPELLESRRPGLCADADGGNRE